MHASKNEWRKDQQKGKWLISIVKNAENRFQAEVCVMWVNEIIIGGEVEGDVWIEVVNVVLVNNNYPDEVRALICNAAIAHSRKGNERADIIKQASKWIANDNLPRVVRTTALAALWEDVLGQVRLRRDGGVSAAGGHGGSSSGLGS